MTTEVENLDYVVCRVCGHRGKILYDHIRKKHSLSEYRERFNVSIVASKYKDVDESRILKNRERAKAYQDRKEKKKREDRICGGTENQDYIVCGLCGEKFVSLMSHLSFSHKIDKETYLSRFNAILVAPNFQKTVKIRSGKNHPYYGKKRDGKTCQKISVASRITNQREITKKRHSRAGKEIWQRPEVREKIKISTNLFYSDKKKVEERNRKHWESRERNGNWVVSQNCYEKGKVYFWRLDKHLPFYSSYEKMFLNRFIDDPKIVDVSIFKGFIPYVDCQEKGRGYKPDYVVTDISGKVAVVEIKPIWKIATNFDNTIEKARAALDFCSQKKWTYEIWTESELEIPVAKCYQPYFQQAKEKLDGLRQIL